MTRVPKRRVYSTNVAQVRRNDAAHDEKMRVIAARGGKTLKQMRSLSMKKKDEFISFYRDGGPYLKYEKE